MHSSDRKFHNEIDAIVNLVLDDVPGTDVRLEQIRVHQLEDELCRNLAKYVEEGWPEKWRLPGTLQQYWQYQAQITVEHGILYFGTQSLIPYSLRLEILDLIHEGHQGITKCCRHAMSSVSWPGDEPPD